MALECSLFVLGASNPDQLLQRALPPEALDAPLERLDNGALVGDFREKLGFVLRARAGINGYVEAETDASTWTWELPSYGNLTFVFVKDFARATSRMNMLHMVARVMTTGDEDLALVLNGQVALLRRLAGQVQSFEAGGFWDTVDRAGLPQALSR